MSIMLLKNPSKLQSIRDDLESLFWLVLYNSLLYLSHNLATLQKLCRQFLTKAFLLDKVKPREIFESTA